MHKHGSEYFACRHPHPPDPRVGVKRSNSTFSEHGHVAYQIKGNHDCSIIVANVLPADPLPISTPTLGLGSKGQNSTLSEQGHVAYQIKGNHECSNMVANILPADTPLTIWVKGSKFNIFRTMSCCLSN